MLLKNYHKLLYIDVVCSVQTGAGQAMLDKAYHIANHRQTLLCSTDHALQYWEHKGFKPLTPKHNITLKNTTTRRGNIYHRHDHCQFMIHD